MALKIVTKRRYINNIQKISSWISLQLGKKVAEEFVLLVENKLKLLSKQPKVGVETELKNIRSILVGKGFQNKIYYTVRGKELVIINIRDTRRNLLKKTFNKIQ